MCLEGFGEKSINNLLEAIEVSKENSLERLIFALGIRYVGAKTAKILAKEFKTLDNLINTDYDTLVSISDVGKKIGDSIIKYFEDEQNIKEINKLKELGVNTEYKNNESSNILEGKVFVLTGTLPTLTRDEAKEMIENSGGVVTSSVSKKTDYILLGENPGSKYDKGKELGITMLNEEEFKKMFA